MYTKNMVFAQHNLTIVILSMLFLVISINYIIVIDREVLAQQKNVKEGKLENKNNIDFSAISVGVLTGSVGISIAILTAYINKKGNIESQIKNDLRNKRISVYSEIFKLMLPLSVFSNNLKFYEQLEYL